MSANCECDHPQGLHVQSGECVGMSGNGYCTCTAFREVLSEPEASLPRPGSLSIDPMGDLAAVFAKLRWAVESGEFSAMVKPAEAALLLRALESPRLVIPDADTVKALPPHLTPEEIELLVSDVSVIRHDGGTDGR